MLNMLFSFIFGIINMLANAIFGFLLSGLNIFIGEGLGFDTALIYGSVFTALNLVSNYIIFAVDMLCIPRALFEFTFTLMFSLLTFVAIARTYVFIAKIYEKLKP